MSNTPLYGLGVVIGKFLPPHKGHEFLIHTALAQCDNVRVILCEKPSDPIPGELRASWLRELCPGADIMVIDDRYDENDSRVWAINTIEWLGRAPDVVFTSESYGDVYARYMGCVHVLVDQARITVPCSGTAVRKDAFAMWNFISPPVRQWFTKRIVVLGAESTGTTTLSELLAEHYQTNWVEEYGREYSQQKWANGQFAWSSDEFLAIAKEQTRREHEAARLSNRLMICDTNAFATTLWHRRYMGHNDTALETWASTYCRADLYILTGDEIPFIQDGLRDGEHIRHEMQDWFREALAQQDTPWIEVIGSRGERLKQATSTIDQLFRL